MFVIFITYVYYIYTNKSNFFKIRFFPFTVYHSTVSFLCPFFLTFCTVFFSSFICFSFSSFSKCSFSPLYSSLSLFHFCCSVFPFFFSSSFSFESYFTQLLLVFLYSFSTYFSFSLFRCSISDQCKLLLA